MIDLEAFYPTRPVHAVDILWQKAGNDLALFKLLGNLEEEKKILQVIPEEHPASSTVRARIDGMQLGANRAPVSAIRNLVGKIGTRSTLNSYIDQPGVFEAC